MQRPRSSRLRAFAPLSLCGLSLAGCLDRPVEPVEPRTTSTVVERLTQSSLERIDVLLVVDDSGSMGDKQRILAEAVPRLVEGPAQSALPRRDGRTPGRPARLSGGRLPCWQ